MSTSATWTSSGSTLPSESLEGIVVLAILLLLGLSGAGDPAGRFRAFAFLKAKKCLPGGTVLTETGELSGSHVGQGLLRDSESRCLLWDEGKQEGVVHLKTRKGRENVTRGSRCGLRDQ